MTAYRVAVIGECMIELRREGDRLVSGFGGDTLNTAVYLARMNPSLHLHYVTALGADGNSERMLAAWGEEGLDTRLVQRLVDKNPGLYWIETDDRGERTFQYWRNDAAARYWLERDRDGAVRAALLEMDAIYLSGVSLAVLPAASRTALFELLARFRDGGGKVLFDNNYRPRLWAGVEDARAAYQRMLALTDTAFLTLDDEQALWGEESLEELLARTRRLGVGEIVLKRGAEPCLVATAEGLLEVPASPVPVAYILDTTAAGDSFSAGYLARRLAGDGPAQAAEAGHRLAGTVIQHRGAIIPPHSMPQ